MNQLKKKTERKDPRKVFMYGDICIQYEYLESKPNLDWFYFGPADTMVKMKAHVLYFEYLYHISIRFVAIPM